MNSKRVFLVCLFMAFGIFSGAVIAQPPVKSDFQDSGLTAAADQAQQEHALADTQAENTVALTVARGRVRATPSLEATIKFHLPKGTVVTVMENRDEWYRIEDTGGRYGYPAPPSNVPPGSAEP